MQDTTPLDRSQIPTPNVRFSPEALSQYQLILSNDFTLKGRYFRLLISGKGCDGFTYSVGFTDWIEDDLLVPVRDEKDCVIADIEVAMDPFTAFYLQNCSVDYIQDFANNNEGFTIKNENQKNFAGKFWKQDEGKIPPLKKGL